MKLKPYFALHQQLYMLDLLLSFWRYWQRNKDRIPGEPKKLTFKQYAKQFIDYWQKY